MLYTLNLPVGVMTSSPLMTCFRERVLSSTTTTADYGPMLTSAKFETGFKQFEQEKKSLVPSYGSRTSYRY